MRCVARGLIAALLTVLLCLYVALTSSNVNVSFSEGEDDEAVRLLEGSDIPSSTSKTTQTSLSAIIVVITCLIIISILIAAMTMDPSTTGDDYPTDDEESSILYPEVSPAKSGSFFGIQGYDNMFDDETSPREL